MTPKEHRELQIELRDWATDLEFRDLKDSKGTKARRRRWERARLLKLAAAELDRVPEEQ